MPSSDPTGFRLKQRYPAWLRIATDRRVGKRLEFHMAGRSDRGTRIGEAYAETADDCEAQFSAMLDDRRRFSETGAIPEAYR